MVLQHGGQLNEVARQYGIAEHKWLDLSTGIAPFHYPVPEIPSNLWANLPKNHDSLLAAAGTYYGCKALLPISGSQSLIQRLPDLWFHRCTKVGYTARDMAVYLPEQGYKEHEKAWCRAGLRIYHYKERPIAEKLEPRCVVVLINPNNPTGKLISKGDVLALLQSVKQQQGLLIVDEAFMDAVAGDYSVVSYAEDPALLVLRSMGKFFGLAGMRLGFVAASPDWLNLIADDQGPWPVSGPAQYIGQCALANMAWQHQQREQVKKTSQQLGELLKMTFGVSPKCTPLFCTIYLTQAPLYFQQLCEQGIYVRLTDDRQALRFGLPHPKDFARLALALQTLSL